ncbi:MAG: DUF4397 domain-containing protein [Candidatus Kapabacteria bacterium]|nr:DUF4397 domain-containing protein [Candidatus Kapabacteria bacterium]
MKTFIIRMALLLAATSYLQAAGTAKLQVIHNAADPAAETVDIYVGATKRLDDFKFRTASPFVDLPAGVPLTIAVAPASSMSVADALATFTVTLEENGTYLGIANGVLAPDKFAANPAGTPIAFKIFAIDKARTKADSTSSVDIKVFHGATDVGAVDIYAGDNKILTGVGYGVSSQYLTVPPASYVIGVAPAGGTPIARFTADVSSLAGSAITVLASGFLDPSKNGTGAAFGLFAVTSAGGPFIALPAVPAQEKAIIQIVHNSADPIAASVDIYVDGTLAVDDFAFRTATPAIELDVNKAYKVGVAPSTSTSASDTLVNFNVALPAGRYVVFANGLVQPGFAANPSGESTGFTIYPITSVRTSAQSPDNLDFAVFHGATDAPAVDVRVGGSNIVSSLAYGKSTPYISVPAQNYVVDVAPAGGAVLASYSVPGLALKGQSAIVFASGFLDPSANKNGPSFGLYALVGNNVVKLEQATTSVRDVPELPEASVAPNPTAGDVSARFIMPSDGSVKIRVHDLAGSIVKEATLGYLTAGQHDVPVTMMSATSGSYIMTIDAGPHRSVIPFAVSR